MFQLREPERVPVSAIQQILLERRSKLRYPLVLNVRYRILRRKLHSGVGQAVNLSSGGALVASQQELGLGEELEINIEWPPLLDGCIALQLVAIASVVRCAPSSFAVRFRRHQFRTLRSRVQPNQVQPIPASAFRAPAKRLAIG
jgi:hypothetical protein